MNPTVAAAYEGDDEDPGVLAAAFEDAPEGGATAPPERKPVLIGTGMPASILLQTFGVWVRDAFGHTPYQVGSSVHGKEWRDVDVRLILPDDEFDALFPGYRSGHQIDAKWSFLCAAISALAKQQTGLPIDFQVQRQSEANERFSPREGTGTFRQPLMHFNYFDVERELKRRAEAEANADE